MGKPVVITVKKGSKMKVVDLRDERVAAVMRKIKDACRRERDDNWAGEADFDEIEDDIRRMCGMKF